MQPTTFDDHAREPRRAYRVLEVALPVQARGRGKR
jgi:hypothetical protein